MRVLISGVGVAGPTLAYWLRRYGHEPTLIEKAPRLRTGGYVIDFWGAGFDIADRMGLVPELMDKGYVIKEVAVMDRAGKRAASFSAEVFWRMTGGRYISIQRSVLADSIYKLLDGEGETIFGDSIVSIEDSGHGVRVGFEHGEARDFDLVIGADGLHSRVRELVFGPQSRFEKYLGYKVAAFEVQGYRPRNEATYLMYTELGQQLSRFTMRDDRTLFLFVFADSDPEFPRDIAGQKSVLTQRYGASGWECPRVLEALDRCDELYFDRVSQIRMEGLWSKGRVSLIGDAASCVSLLAGQGTALAMIAAYILAGEIHRSNGNHQSAFEAYQKLFGPFVARKQKAAQHFGGAFAPRTSLGLYFRNQIMNLLSIPWIADWAVGRDLVDRIELPNY